MTRYANIKHKEKSLVIPFTDVEGFRGQNYYCINEATEYAYIKQNIKIESYDELVKSVLAAKKLLDHIFDTKNKPVNWGQTFCDWGLMNETMMQIESGVVEIKKGQLDETVK